MSADVAQNYSLPMSPEQRILYSLPKFSGWLVFFFICLFVSFFVFFFFFFSFLPFVRMRKDSGFYVGRGWRRGKGFFCTKPPPQQLTGFTHRADAALLYPSSESSLEPSCKPKGCFVGNEPASPPSSVSTCFYVPKSWGQFPSPHTGKSPPAGRAGRGKWWCWGCMEAVWGHGRKHWHECALLIGERALAESKSILCPEARIDNNSTGTHVIIPP